MQIDIQEISGNTVAKIAGPLDGIALAHDRTAGETLAASASNSLELDLRDVPFLDTSGVGFLVQLVKRLRNAGQTCRLSNVAGQPADLMAALGLLGVFGVSDVSKDQNARAVIVAATTTENAGQQVATLAQVA